MEEISKPTASCQQETESSSDISEAVDEDPPIDDADSTSSSDDEPDVIIVEEGDLTNGGDVSGPPNFHFPQFFTP